MPRTRSFLRRPRRTAARPPRAARLAALGLALAAAGAPAQTATAQPAAQPWAPGSGPMTLEKKAAILTTPTTEYERHVKGLIGAGG